MTRLKVEPGICGMTAIITADSEDGMECEISVETQCKMIEKLFEGIGGTVNAYEICMPRGDEEKFAAGLIRQYPTHAACPMISALIKCVEAECGLALKKDVSFSFISE